MLALYFKCWLYVSIFLWRLGDRMLCFCARLWGRQAGSRPGCQGWLQSWQPWDPAKPTLTDGFWVPADLWSLLVWPGTIEPVHWGPLHVYLTKPVIAYMLINMFALHVVGGGPQPSCTTVQVRTSLPSLYVTQRKSRKSTMRHINMTKTGKDKFGTDARSCRGWRRHQELFPHVPENLCWVSVTRDLVLLWHRGPSAARTRSCKDAAGYSNHGGCCPTLSSSFHHHILSP